MIPCSSSSRSAAALIVITTLALGAARAAAVPDVLTYAASLSEGASPADGTFAVVIEIYDAAAGGAPLFTQIEASLAVTGGELVVDIGGDPTNPLSDDVLARPALFVALTIDGVELEPRAALTSVPYARRAARAETLADDVITAAHLAGGGIPIYLAHAACADPLALTLTTAGQCHAGPCANEVPADCSCAAGRMNCPSTLVGLLVAP